MQRIQINMFMKRNYHNYCWGADKERVLRELGENNNKTVDVILRTH